MISKDLLHHLSTTTAYPSLSQLAVFQSPYNLVNDAQRFFLNIENSDNERPGFMETWNVWAMSEWASSVLSIKRDLNIYIESEAPTIRKCHQCTCGCWHRNPWNTFHSERFPSCCTLVQNLFWNEFDSIIWYDRWYSNFTSWLHTMCQPRSAAQFFFFFFFSVNAHKYVYST